MEARPVTASEAPTPRPPSHKRVAALLLALLSGACSGEIQPNSGSGAPDAPGSSGARADEQAPGQGPGGDDAAGDDLPSDIEPGVDGCLPELSAPRAVLAPLRQYQNVLRDLLGPDAVSAQDAIAELEFQVIDRPRMTTALLDQVLRLAEDATESIRGRTGEVIGCAALDDRSCVRDGIERFARRAFKRPLETSELDGLMTVYDEGLANAPEGAAPASSGTDNVAPLATLDTSYVSSWENLDAVIDGVTPLSSSDYTNGAYGNWREGTPAGGDWVSFSWSAERTLAAAEVYWWQDGAGIALPSTATLERWDGAGWVSLGAIGTAADTFNRVDFTPVATTGLRVSMSATGAYTGILEVRIFEQGQDAAPTTSPPAESATLLALTAALIAPPTLYRTEFEQGPTADSLTAHERAAALAALLLDSVPDEELLAAADDGSLLQPGVLDQQLDRLLQLPRVRDHLTQVLMHAFGVPKLFQSPKDEEIFPEYAGALQLSMYEETRLLIEDVLWTRGAPLSELLSSRESFVDPALAELYGIPYPGTGEEFVPVTLPESRAGLLTQPSMLSVLSRTDKTSVVARGLFVRGAVLCLPKVGAPPASVQAQVEEQLSAESTQAELAEYRATTSPCNGCHSQFDRFGLVLESFDAIGRERAQPADPVDLTGLFTFQGTVESPTDMLDQIAQTPQFVDCMTERMLSFALSEAAVTGSLCLPTDLAESLHGGATDIATLLSAVVKHPAFGRRSPSEN
jgi:hypothetical protein